MDPIHRGKGVTELKIVSRTVGQISLQSDNSNPGFYALKFTNFASALSFEIKSNNSSIFGGYGNTTRNHKLVVEVVIRFNIC